MDKKSKIKATFIIGSLIVLFLVFSITFISAHNYSCVPNSIKARLTTSKGYAMLTHQPQIDIEISKGTLILASGGRQVCK